MGTKPLTQHLIVKLYMAILVKLCKFNSFVDVSKFLVFSSAAMDEEASNSQRRMSTRTRKVAPRMAAALASSDNRTQVCLCMLLLSLCLTLYLYIEFLLAWA